MAGRPNRAGLDYFSLDCHMEEKVRLIQAEFGLKGFAVVVKLYQKIYGEFGYYCEWNDDSVLLFMSENGVCSDSRNLINEIVSACIRRDIFSAELYEKYGILTSAGVQKRYLAAAARRDNICMIKEYLLIEIPKERINVVINSISVDINSISSDRNEQSKVKESKVKESKEVYSDSKESERQTDVRRAVEKWNSLGINPVKRFDSNSNRYKMLSSRIAEYGIDEVLAAMDKVKDSTFLQGGSKKGWMITLEWFVRPNNFPKVYEGNYDDNHSYHSYQNDDAPRRRQ